MIFSVCSVFSVVKVCVLKFGKPKNILTTEHTEYTEKAKPRALLVLQ